MILREPHKILLVITADPRGDLPGCDADGARIAASLPDYEVRWVRGATRGDVFAAFDELYPDLRADSSVVVFVSGHGGIARFPAGFGPGFPPDLEWPFFVTADQTHDEVFRSILALELSGLVGQCARIAANTTVIIDTCFAQGLLRSRVRLKSVGERIFAVPTHLVAEHPSYSTYTAWLAALRAAPRPASLLDDAVICAAAAAAGQPAYESTDRHGRAGGAFTIELCESLAEARARRACWRQLIAGVRERLVERWGEGFQRPEATGPSDRRVFELGRVDVSASATSFVSADGSQWIRSGRLHGTAPGDRFTAGGPRGFLELRVVEALDDRARVEMPAAGTLAPGNLVFPAQCTSRIHVAIEDCPQQAALAGQIAGGMRVTTCAPGERPGLRLRRHADGLGIHDDDGRLVSISDRERVLADLDALARARGFEAAIEHPPESCAPGDWRCRLLHCRDEHERELADGDEVREGDRLWLELGNLARGEIPGLHVNVVERGADGRLRVLTARQHPAGVQVRGGTTQRVFWYPEGPHGRRQVWPADAPRMPREVAWYLVASPVPLDLRTLAVDTAGAGGTPTASHSESSRAPDIVPVRPGEPVRPLREPQIRWTRRRLGFLLVPQST